MRKVGKPKKRQNKPRRLGEPKWTNEGQEPYYWKPIEQPSPKELKLLVNLGCGRIHRKRYYYNPHTGEMMGYCKGSWSVKYFFNRDSTDTRNLFN